MRVVILAALLVAAPLGAQAQTYVVREGDTLGEIALAHGVTVDELVRTNGITDPDQLRPGQELTLTDSEGEVVERGVIHIVRKGVTLRRISLAYEVPLSRLVKANRIRDPNLIQLGARILIPGADRVIPIATKHRPPCLRDPVEIYRVRTGESRQIVLTQCDGKVWEPGREEISHFLDRTADGSAPLLHPRLLQNLQKVVDRFPGRRVEVVSAYRPPRGERGSSRHCKAKALDFRIQGVPNARLRDYVRTFEGSGVGYYPNSTFIHLDVRDRRAFWVDWSGPGEAPRYGTLERDPADDVVVRPRRGERRRGAVMAARRGRRDEGATPSRTTSAAP